MSLKLENKYCEWTELKTIINNKLLQKPLMVWMQYLKLFPIWYKWMMKNNWKNLMKWETKTYVERSLHVPIFLTDFADHFWFCIANLLWGIYLELFCQNWASFNLLLTCTNCEKNEKIWLPLQFKLSPQCL